jgi:hypothetical protein
LGDFTVDFFDESGNQSGYDSWGHSWTYFSNGTQIIETDGGYYERNAYLPDSTFSGYNSNGEQYWIDILGNYFLVDFGGDISYYD